VSRTDGGSSRQWPDLASRAQALRQKLTSSVLYDGGGSWGPGTLYGAIDRCAGLQRNWLIKGFGDRFTYWERFLSRSIKGCPCVASGRPGWPCWMCAGRRRSFPLVPVPASRTHESRNPASDTGGPFCQLAGLIYLSSEQIPDGTLSLGLVTQDMLRAQRYQFRDDSGLTLAEVASASDPDALPLHDLCCVDCCEGYHPYISGMGASRPVPDTYRMLNAFQQRGGRCALATGHQTAAARPARWVGFSPTTAAETAISTRHGMVALDS